MNYDNWKLGAHPSKADELLAQRCETIEDNMDRILTASVALVNQKSIGQFSVESSLADWWSSGLEGPLMLEMQFRLERITTDEKCEKQTADEIAGHLEDLTKQIRECARAGR